MHNKKIGIGFVGAGWMGSTLIQRIIESDDTELLALHQRSQKRAEETLKNLGLEKSIYTDSFDDILSNPKIDAVFICSPNSLHGQQSITPTQTLLPKPVGQKTNYQRNQLKVLRFRRCSTEYMKSTRLSINMIGNEKQKTLAEKHNFQV